MLMACAGYETLRDISVIEKMVGAEGFEPPTPKPPAWYATRLRYAPPWPFIADTALLVQAQDRNKE